MTISSKTILGIGTLSIVVVFGLFVFGFYQMADEDRYGDLVSFYPKVEDGDIIFRCKNSGEIGQDTAFNEFGVIEKSWGSVFVWDTFNTMKQDLYTWAEKGNSERVKVYRKTDSTLNIFQTKLINGSYNYLMDSDKLEFVTENY